MTQQQQPTKSTTPAQDAAGIVAALERRLDTHDDRIAANKHTRGELAFDAHTGNTKAKKQLEDLVAEGRRLEDERGDLVAALEEAKRRHLRAIQDEAADAGRAEAREIAGLFEEWQKVSVLMDQAREALVRCGTAYADFAKGINAAGCPHPSMGQARLMFLAYVNTIVFELPWTKDFEYRYPAPGDRKNAIAPIVDGWRNGAAGTWIDQKLAGAPLRLEAAE